MNGLKRSGEELYVSVNLQKSSWPIFMVFIKESQSALEIFPIYMSSGQVDIMIVMDKFVEWPTYHLLCEKRNTVWIK